MKILIANRGEIAVRIIRACREMGLPTVAVYSDCDRDARHVRDADQAFHIGPSEAAKSYLRIDAMLDAAQALPAPTRCIPGYGFLAENAAFARACRDAGLTFIGPSPEAIALMGSKTAAREAAIRAGVPVVPGTERPLDDAVGDDEIARIADGVGYPLVVKAVAGGGGKGMRTVDDRARSAGAIRTARSEAGSAFGDTAIYLERRLAASAPHRDPAARRPARHGRAVRRARVLDPAAPSEGRRRVSVDRGVAGPARGGWLPRRPRSRARSSYSSAGTIEFLLDEDGAFYFLEMNTRLQVEHPVTEMVTSIDLVQWQIRIARGESARHRSRARAHAARPRDRVPHLRRGSGSGLHAVARPDPRAAPGRRGRACATTAASAPGIRVPVFYDSMIAKLDHVGRRRAGRRSIAWRARCASTRCSGSARRSRSSSG